MDRDLKENVNELLEEMMANSNLLPVEYKIANAVSMALNKEEAQPNQRETLAMILTPPEVIVFLRFKSYKSNIIVPNLFLKNE